VENERQAQDHLAETFAVNAAEGVVYDARFAELQAQGEAAHRRLAAAKGLLTKARKDGSADGWMPPTRSATASAGPPSPR
jgi:hypothetical protein